MLPPGSTIGILGGGQLGRMMAVAGLQLGYKVIGFAPEGDNVAADASSDFITADWDDAAALAAFTGRCDVVTWEWLTRRESPRPTARRTGWSPLPRARKAKASASLSQARAARHTCPA